MPYTNIDDPSAYFQALAYTASTATPSQTFTNDGNSDLKPDFLWIKNRAGWGSRDHMLFDSSRGVNKNLRSNSTTTEATDSYQTFNTDGFTVRSAFELAYSATYVAWQWKCNGGTTSSNTDGSITSTVQANQDAGFSIVTYTAPSSSGNFTAGHGLGVKPAMVITKSRSATGGWWTWHKDLAQPNYYIGLHSTVAQAFEANIWGAGFDTSTIGLNVAASAQASQTYVAYCFAEKQGYSKFGKYTGNGSPNGPFIYTGFKPAFVIVKKSNNTGSWVINDSKRIGYNPNNYDLYANLGAAEEDNDRFDLLSNGFKARSTSSPSNASGDTYIYMAFAENPFVTSTGIMGTAR